jgi:hypothetical protein
MGAYTDFDLDAIPWWYLKKKTALYADGSVRGDFARPIMQFTMGEPNGEKIRSWESDFRDILAYLRSIEPPKYPLAVDKQLVSDGEKVFTKTCSQCHGTYGPGGKYPNRVVPIDVVGTDRPETHWFDEGVPLVFQQNVVCRRQFARRGSADGLCRSSARWSLGIRTVLSQWLGTRRYMEFWRRKLGRSISVVSVVRRRSTRRMWDSSLRR